MTRERATKPKALRALGEVIRATRSEQGYTQERFAAHAGIDRSYYGAIERGKFNLTVHTLLRISAGLNVSPAELLARSLNDKPSPVVKRATVGAKDGDA